EADTGYWCSAQFIGRNLVLTASHCVQEEKPPYRYYRAFAFYLQYERQKWAHAFGSQCVGNPKGWAQPSQARYVFDYAMILTDAPSDVGWFGTQWGWEGKFNRATKIGYPHGVSGGQVVQVDVGPITIQDGIVELRHGNKAEQAGSSGGAWV